MKRNRLLYFFLILLTIFIGLASRKYAYALPDLINLVLGDALWALMVYWILGFLFPSKKNQHLFFGCLSICFLVECSQLLQAEWIICIRKNKFGALILGQGFLWTDFVAYTFGAGFGVLFEKKLYRNFTAKTERR